jgi:quercetin dioxygenase-like cupin family protein
MTIEIRRFGVGNRRPDGPSGTSGVTGQVIHSDARGVVSELAFARAARIEPHANPNTTWFIVIEGGGWVGVGDERTRVAAGEAVLWPPDIPHAAWTEHSEMRAFVVEFAGADDTAIRGILEGSVREVPAGAQRHGATAGQGVVRHDTGGTAVSDPEAGEPA